MEVHKETSSITPMRTFSVAILNQQPNRVKTECVDININNRSNSIESIDLTAKKTINKMYNTI